MQPVSNINTGYQGYSNPAVTATISSSGTKSTAIHLKGFSLVAILFPATFTGTAVTFEASADGVTFLPVYASSGSAVSYTIAQGRYVAVDPKDTVGANYLKIVSGSTEAGARTLTCSLKGI